MANTKGPPSDEPDNSGTTSTTRGILSLVLFVYLFGLWAVMASPLGGSYSSELSNRLLGVLQLYTQPLQLDVRSVPYYLYSGDPVDYEHLFRVELTSPSGETSVYTVPGDELGSGVRDPYRYQRLAKVVASQAEMGADTIPAEITKGIGQYFVKHAGGGKASVQCIRRRPQPLVLEFDGLVFSEDARDASYEDILYRSTVLVDSRGDFQVIKEMAAEHSAPTTN